MTAEIAAAIAAAASAVEAGEHDDQFLHRHLPDRLGHVDQHERQRGRRTPRVGRGRGSTVHPNDHVNAGQSSNDTFPTAVAAAALREVTVDAAPPLGRPSPHRSRLRRVRFADVVKAGRTHLMDAVPVTLGAEFGGLRGAGARGDRAARRRAPRGSGGCRSAARRSAAASTPTPTSARGVVERLAQRWSIPLTIAPEPLRRAGARATASSRCPRSCAGSRWRSIKIANDIRWMASGPAAGLGEIRLPELQAGSSIMPGKVNPVMAEMLTQVCVQVFGNDAAIAFAGSQGSFELNTYQPVMAANAPRLDPSARRGRARCSPSRCVDGIEADEERCRQLAEASPSIATALNAALGYDRCRSWSRRRCTERRSIVDVVVDAGALDRGDGRAPARRPGDGGRLPRVVGVARGAWAAPVRCAPFEFAGHEGTQREPTELTWRHR